MKQKFVCSFVSLLLIFCCSCNAIKTIKVLKKGEIAPMSFKETIFFESRAGLMIVKVTIAGKDYNFIYDSGAVNAVTKEVADELHLKTVLDQTAEDAEGKKGGIKFALIDELKMGSISFRNFGAAIIDLKQVPELACLKVDGLIGANMMRKAFWQLDYVKQTIVFASIVDSLKIPANAFSFPFKPAISGTPIVEVELENIKSGGNIFDTGSTGGITLSAPSFKKVTKQNPKFKYVRGVGSNSAGLYGAGFDTSYIAKTNLNIGTLKIPARHVEFKRQSGNLGSDFFKDYIVTLDWKKKKIYFVPQATEKNESLTFGFSTTKKENKLVAAYIYENSPAALAGLKLGDEIISINGKNYTDLQPGDYCEMITKGVPWKKETLMTLVFRTGTAEPKTVILEKKNLLD